MSSPNINTISAQSTEIAQLKNDLEYLTRIVQWYSGIDAPARSPLAEQFDLSDTEAQERREVMVRKLGDLYVRAFQRGLDVGIQLSAEGLNAEDIRALFG